MQTLVEADQKRQIAALGTYMAGKSRIFIFIHGVNTSQNEIWDAYQIMEQSIEAHPRP